ncbi:hypothetical protein IQ06DRAFT_375287 [Phaeosphaeriaceae sp. SRC1lsM3a]|nr:hypothetical protein IQ06DRAFT_375287 [Stagonospora sp. SRC1lsM3a]
MAMQASPPSATDFQLRYHTAHRGVARDCHGKFKNFVRKLDASHLENGYWRFTSKLDEKRAYTLGHQTPESILCAVHCGDGTYSDIQLRWVPGKMDPNVVGALSGNAAQHLQNIHEARRFLGKSMAVPGTVPLYPVESRMKGYWETKRAAVLTSSMIVEGSKSFASPLPPTHNLHLPSLEVRAAAGGSQAQHDGLENGWDNFSLPAPWAPSPAASLRSRNSMAPSRSSTTTPPKPAQSQPAGLSSASQNRSQSPQHVSTHHSCPASGVKERFRGAMEPGSQEPTAVSLRNIYDQQEGLTNVSQDLSSRTGSSHFPSATPGRSRQPAYTGARSQSRDTTRSPQDSDNRLGHQSTCSASPSRSNVMAGHLSMVPPPSPLTHHSRAPRTGSISSDMPLASAFNILGLSSSPNAPRVRPPQLQEATQSQLMPAHESTLQSWESHVMVCDNSPPGGFDHTPAAKFPVVTNSPELSSGLSEASARSQEAANLRGTARPLTIETSGKILARYEEVNSLKGDLEADCNNNYQNKNLKNDDDSPASEGGTCQLQPNVDDVYFSLPCMDCGRENEHTSECCIGSEFTSLLVTIAAKRMADLQPMENITILNYRNLEQSVQRFDPGPWTTHQGPPPEPEPETAEDQIRGMAEVIRNEDSYKNDNSLHCLPDEAMILLWAFKTSPNIEVIDE